MTESEFLNLQNQVSSIESRLDAQFGKDPSSLHPHGNHTLGQQHDLTQENITKIFTMLAKIDTRLNEVEIWWQGLHGADGVTVEKNTIRGTIPPIPSTFPVTICDPDTGTTSTMNFVVYP